MKLCILLEHTRRENILFISYVESLYVFIHIALYIKPSSFFLRYVCSVRVQCISTFE